MSYQEEEKGAMDSIYMSPSSQGKQAKPCIFDMLDMSAMLATPSDEVTTSSTIDDYRKEETAALTKKSEETFSTSKLLQPNHVSHLTLKERFQDHEDYITESTYIEAEDAVTSPTFLGNSPQDSPSRKPASGGLVRNQSVLVLRGETEYDSFVSVPVDTQDEASDGIYTVPSSVSSQQTPTHQKSVPSDLADNSSNADPDPSTVYLDLESNQSSADSVDLSTKFVTSSATHTGLATTLSMGGKLTSQNKRGKNKDNQNGGRPPISATMRLPKLPQGQVKLRKTTSNNPTPSNRPISMPFAPPPAPPTTSTSETSSSSSRGSRPLPPTPKTGELPKISEEVTSQPLDHSIVGRQSSMPTEPPPSPPMPPPSAAVNAPLQAPPLPSLAPNGNEPLPPPLPPITPDMNASPQVSNVNAPFPPALPPLNPNMAATLPPGTPEKPPPLLPRTAKSFAPKLPYRPPSPFLSRSGEFPTPPETPKRGALFGDQEKPPKLPKAPVEANQEKENERKAPGDSPVLPSLTNTKQKVHPVAVLIKERQNNANTLGLRSKKYPNLQETSLQSETVKSTPKIPSKPTYPPPKPDTQQIAAPGKKKVPLLPSKPIPGIPKKSQVSPEKPSITPQMLSSPIKRPQKPDKPKPIVKSQVNSITSNDSSSVLPNYKQVHLKTKAVNVLPSKRNPTAFAGTSEIPKNRPKPVVSRHASNAFANAVAQFDTKPVTLSPVKRSKAVLSPQVDNSKSSELPNLSQSTEVKWEDTKDMKPVENAVTDRVDLSDEGSDVYSAIDENLVTSPDLADHSPADSPKNNESIGSTKLPDIPSKPKGSPETGGKSLVISPTSSPGHNNRKSPKMRPTAPPPPRPSITPQQSFEEKATKPAPVRPPPPSQKNINAAKLRRAATKIENRRNLVSTGSTLSPKKTHGAKKKIQITTSKDGAPNISNNSPTLKVAGPTSGLESNTYSCIQEVSSDSFSTCSEDSEITSKDPVHKKKLSLGSLTSSMTIIKNRLRYKTKYNDAEKSLDEINEDQQSPEEGIYAGIDEESYRFNNANSNCNHVYLTSQCSLGGDNDDSGGITYAMLDHDYFQENGERLE